MQRAVATEMLICLALNRVCHARGFRNVFFFVSWLGDGKFWYGLIASLPFIFGERGGAASLQMIKVGLLNLAIYHLIKGLAGRARPCAVENSIMLGAAPLDRYSFPSGHTMHAVAFSTITIAYVPQLAWILMPLISFIALSRIVLGLHYPTDVLAGAVIGALTASYIPRYL